MKKIIALIIILILLAGAGIMGLSYVKGLDKAFKPNSVEEVLIDIPMGSTTTDIGNILESNGIIGSASKFKLFSKLNKYDERYVAGIYQVSPGMTPTEICEKIVSGDTASFRFTVPEGLQVKEVIDIIAATGHADKAKLEFLINNGDFSDYEFIRYIPLGADNLEGYLFPDTYTIPYGYTEEEILKAMLNRFEDVYNTYILPTFLQKKEELEYYGIYSVHDIMSIAAIIEKETLFSDDKPIVSSVIYNRLDVGMKLQMDPTVLYALGINKEDVLYSDLEVESPYNTYYVDGLPIGPICSPGLESIEAALNPVESDYLYFVLSDKGDGSIKYSENDWEFYEDKEAYYASRNDD